MLVLLLAFLVGVLVGTRLPVRRPRDVGASEGARDEAHPDETAVVAVPVCTHTPVELIHAVTRLYRAHPLVLVHVVVVPRDLPLEAGLTPVEEEELRAMIEDLRDAAEADLGTTVRVEILHGRDPARTLLEWIAQTHPAVVVLSLHAEHTELSPTALSLLRYAQAQVWVWRDAGDAVGAVHG